jgi:FkbM family methyltransferase
VSALRSLRYARRYRNWRELARERAARRAPARVELRSGLVFESPADTNVLRLVNGVFFKRCYTRGAIGDVGPGDTVVDVGANVGVFAVYAALRTRGPVLAVEPAPANLACLERNLRRNGCGHVQVVACALAERDGSARLTLYQSGVRHSLTPGGARATAAAVEVRTRSLPSLLDEHGLARVDFLKLDCEGAEGLALPAAPEPTLRRLRRVALEFHDDLSPVRHEELERLLARSGMSTRLEWDGRASRGFLFAWR